jgi:hypothetical protein
VRVEVVPGGRRPPAVEAAVYRLVLDGVACAERAGDGRTVVVDIGDAEATLTLPGVAAAAASLALEHARDRIMALDGSLAVHELADGVRVEALLPCGS